MKLRDAAFLGLPSELRGKARVLFEYAAWPPEAALEVIDWLEGAGFAVVGVERWAEVNRLPKWIATSGYEHEPAGAQTAWVRLCAESARGFVREHAGEPGALFNLSAMRAESSAARVEDRPAQGGLWASLLGWLRRGRST